jgi:flagellar L-ring protein precursor FlgH
MKMRDDLKLYLLAGMLMFSSLVAFCEEPQWTMASRLCGDRLARRVGDLFSVVIEETSSAKLDAKQSADKSTDIGGSASFGHPNVDGRKTSWTNATLPAFSATASRKFNGQGSMENKGVLSGSVTVRVMDVLPGGQLLIEGKRTLVMQKETLTFTVMGTVRQEDIAADNSVQSSRVGDLTIRYESNGSVATAQKKGIFDRVIDWINPF